MDGDREQLRVLEAWFALPKWEQTKRRNAARRRAGLPEIETPLAHVRRRNAALRRAGQRPIDPRDGPQGRQE